MSETRSLVLIKANSPVKPNQVCILQVAPTVCYAAWCPVNITLTGVIWAEGLPAEELLPSDWSVGKPVRAFPRFVIGMGEPSISAQCSTWKVALVCARKQTEQAMGSKPVSSVFPRSLFQFLFQVPALSSCSDVHQGRIVT